MNEALLLKVGGVSALLAVPALVLSALFLALFFSGAGERYGPLNDVFAALTLLFLIVPALAVHSLARGQVGWSGGVTALGILGMLVAAGGQLLLVEGVISLGASFVTGGVGFGMVVLWFGGLALLALHHGLLPQGLGWLLVLILALILLLVAASGLRLRPAVWGVSSALTVGLALWFGAFGWVLLRHE